VIREDNQSAAQSVGSLEGVPQPPPPDLAMAELTPFMRQWTAAKRENPDALLFFRMGDFYELFYDDAVTVSRELQLTLTARDRERSQPMCGVPYHAVDQYLTRLLRKGYRIAICDQMEDPKLTKKIVRREVTRVLTPGTALDNGLGQEQNNFLAAFYPAGSEREPIFAVALLDLSTGEFRTAEFVGQEGSQKAADEILKAGSSEVLYPASAALAPTLERLPTRTQCRRLGLDPRFCGAPCRAADECA
jgi:DNA mismatch repair protein MutS